jgi:hypothetical protein
MRLLIRGGSIAAGVGVSRGYVEHLRDRYDRSAVEVVNRSRAGETTFDGVWSFDQDIAPYSPDILLLNFAIDDAFGSVYRSEMKENLVCITRKTRERFSTAIVTMATAHPFENPYDMEAVHIYYRTIREVCVDLGCELIAVHTYWAGYLQEHQLNHSDCLLPDNKLPNALGHTIYAQAIGRHLDHVLTPISVISPF